MKTKLMFIFLFISTLALAQNGQKSISEAIELIKKQNNTSYFEVSDEMFKMMSKADGITAEQKEYISKLSTLKMVRENQKSLEGNELYDIFLANVNLKDYSMLVTTTEPNRKMSFYKRENKNSEKEFLLISNTIIIYLTGTIDIKSLQEMEGIMNLAGRGLDI